MKRSAKPAVTAVRLLPLAMAQLFLASFFLSGVAFQPSHTKLPLLSQNINVYCDGIFDMVHVGHMKACGGCGGSGDAQVRPSRTLTFLLGVGLDLK